MTLKDKLFLKGCILPCVRLRPSDRYECEVRSTWITTPDLSGWSRIVRRATMVRPGPSRERSHLNMAEDIHDALARTLADIRTRLGADAFEDRRKVLALLSDMLPGATRQIRLLGIAIDN